MSIKKDFTHGMCAVLSIERQMQCDWRVIVDAIANEIKNQAYKVDFFLTSSITSVIVFA